MYHCLGFNQISHTKCKNCRCYRSHRSDLIYAIALHRHLARRLADYDYERHFGGVYYLFLRGLAETHEPGCGVFFDRPTAALVERASDLLGLPPGTLEARA